MTMTKTRISRTLALQRGKLIGLAALAATALFTAPSFAQDESPEDGRPVKVMLVNMFFNEGHAWDPFFPAGATETIPVRGLSSDYPTVRCNTSGVCQMTTGMGHANVAASTMALLLSGKFDLRRAYILIAGISGIDPSQGTTGSAAWARYLVDYGISCEIDAREMPTGWPYGYFGIFTKDFTQKPSLDYRTEVFQLNEDLLQKILSLTSNVQLSDDPSGVAQAYRAHYPSAPANQPPRVIQCDTAAGDTWFHGLYLGKRATDWTKILTDGKGVYCTTQQEDNATLNALTRGSQAGLVDLTRVAVLRTASNFDRPYPGQSAYDSLTGNSGGFVPSIVNLYLAGAPFVKDVVARWELWRHGVPKE
jgi:purine nucleoside permease